MNELVVDSPSFNTNRFMPGDLVIVFSRAREPIFSGIVLECQPWVLTIGMYDPHEDSGVFDRFDGQYSLRGIKPYFLDIDNVINGEIGHIALIKPSEYRIP